MTEPHESSTEPVTYDKKDGQWYSHDGVDIKDTQGRKGISVVVLMSTLYNNYLLSKF